MAYPLLVEILQPGNRYAVRFLDTEGDLTDITGFLVALADDHIVIEPANAPARTIDRSQIRAARRIPPQPVRPASSLDKLQRLATRGWPGLEQERLGGWLLRSGAGFTRRANSALAIGDPGLSVPQALDRVCVFYRERQLSPILQVAQPLGEPVDAPVLGGHTADWTISSPTLFMVADLRRLDLTTADLRLTVSAQPQADWLSLHRGGRPLTEAQRAVVTAAPATYATLLHEGEPAAIARLATTDNWVGLTSVEVRPDLRGRGLGRALTLAMLRQARDDGARYAHLQVELDNGAAIGLYTAVGFTRHHQYHYRTLE